MLFECIVLVNKFCSILNMYIFWYNILIIYLQNYLCHYSNKAFLKQKEFKGPPNPHNFPHNTKITAVFYV